MKMDSMIHKKSILVFGSTITAIVLIGMVTATSLDTQAIQALDAGDNSEAIQQLQLATDQMRTFSAVSEQSFVGQSSDIRQGNNGDGENDDEGEGSEEGEGEDADEPGDTDSNDEED
jgi:hypothetical protein